MRSWRCRLGYPTHDNGLRRLNLPFGAGRRFVPGNPFVNAVFGGWNFSMLGTARTGVPFNVTLSRSVADLPDGVTSTPGKGAPPQRPNVDPSVSMSSSDKTPSSWLNPAAFQTPPRGTWGTLPRNALRGPNLWQIDMSASKESQVTEQVGLELCAEVFNIFNRAQYGFPNANFSNLGTFGTITSVVNANPTGSGGPRQSSLRSIEVLRRTKLGNMSTTPYI